MQVTSSQLPPRVAEDRGRVAGEPLPVSSVPCRANPAATRDAVSGEPEARISLKGAVQVWFSLCLDVLLPARCQVLSPPLVVE